MVHSFCEATGVPVDTPAEASIQLARVKYRQDDMISDEAPYRKPLRSGLELLKQTYVNNREAVEGKVYAIDIKKKLLIVQNMFTFGRQEFILTRETVITGIEAFNKIQINDLVYVIYYYDINGKLISSHVHFVAGSDSGSPYDVSEREKEPKVGEYINRLTAPEEHIRSHAALALGNFNDRGAVAFLINVLRNDASGLVRLNSAKALMPAAGSLGYLI